MVVDPGMWKHPDIDGVIGMVMTQDDIGHIGHFESLLFQRTRNGMLGRGQTGVDDDAVVAVEDQADS